MQVSGKVLWKGGWERSFERDTIYGQDVCGWEVAF